MPKDTQHERRSAMEQGLANTRIEGHVPNAGFLADCERMIRGEITSEEMRSNSLKRAKGRDSQHDVSGISPNVS